MRFVLTKNQIAWMKEHAPADWAAYKDTIVEAWSPERVELLENVGKAASEQFGSRMATSQKVPRLRNKRGFSHQIRYVDEAHGLEKIHDRRGEGFVASEWMEHRLLCSRTLVECLSGDVCYGS